MVRFLYYNGLEPYRLQVDLDGSTCTVALWSIRHVCPLTPDDMRWIGNSRVFSLLRWANMQVITVVHQVAASVPVIPHRVCVLLHYPNVTSTHMLVLPLSVRGFVMLTPYIHEA